MKKHIPILIVLITGLLPFIFYFHTFDLPHTHDGLVHLPRIAAFYKALLDGHFPVRWAGDLNYGYGLALFNFIYPLPYYIASFFVFLGLGLTVSFKLVISLSFMLSGIFMYWFAKSFFNNQHKALVVTMLYQFASFRFIELLLRGSFGEVYTYTFLPLVLYGLVLLSKKTTARYILLTSVATALLVLSHNSISLVFFSVAVLFVLFFLPGIRKKIVGFASLFLGIILSAFYWLPAIIEHKFTYGDLFMENLYKGHFAPFWYFFIPNLTNSSNFQIEQISVQIGLFQVIAIILSVILLFKSKEIFNKKIVIFSLILLVGSLFLMQPASLFLWEHVSYLRQFQFPWRLLSVVTIASSLCGIGYFMLPLFKSTRMVYVLTALIIASSFFYWFPRLGYDKINEKEYWNFPLNTTYYGETDIIWSAGPAKKYPTSRIEVASGSAQIENYKKTTVRHTFDVVAKTNTNLVLHVLYFPGWRIIVNGEPVSIQFQDPAFRGEMIFAVPTGKSHVVASFGESKIRFFADMLSLGGLIVLITGFILLNKRNL